MCSEHIIFVWVVDRRSLITVEKIRSSQYSHIVCLTSVDRPHEAFDLIGSSRMLVHCRTLLTVDVDRTPSILICRLFGCSKSSADILERLMKLSLKFGGLTSLVAHFLTSRTLGRNPRVLSENPTPTLFLFFPLGIFELFKITQKAFSCPLFFFKNLVCTPHLLLTFKTMQDAS